jgi:hypothetical protein
VAAGIGARNFQNRNTLKDAAEPSWRTHQALHFGMATTRHRYQASQTKHEKIL